jgi:hypothetical protein
MLRILSHRGSQKQVNHGKRGDRVHPNYEHVFVAKLKKTRKARHHDFIVKVMEDLRTLPTGSAVKVPLESAQDASVPELRSAIHWAAVRSKIKLATSSDDENFYVWKVQGASSKK